MSTKIFFRDRAKPDHGFTSPSHLVALDMKISNKRCYFPIFSFKGVYGKKLVCQYLHIFVASGQWVC